MEQPVPGHDLPLAHQLAIWKEATTDSKLSTFLRWSDDFVRAEAYKLRFYVRNLSASPFPGGSVSSLWIDYTQGDLKSTFNTDKATVPQLRTGDEQLVFEANWIPTAEGTGWFRAKIEAVDKQPVQYSRRIGDDMLPLTGETYYEHVYILSDTQLRIAMEIRELRLFIEKTRKVR